MGLCGPMGGPCHQGTCERDCYIYIYIYMYIHAKQVDNLYLVTGNLTSQLARVKAHAVEFSREHALALLDEAAALAAEGQTELAKRRRAKGARLLYRMAPGSCAKIGAIQTEEGAIVSDPHHMADVLRRH